MKDSYPTYLRANLPFTVSVLNHFNLKGVGIELEWVDNTTFKIDTDRLWLINRLVNTIKKDPKYSKVIYSLLDLNFNELAVLNTESFKKGALEGYLNYYNYKLQVSKNQRAVVIYQKTNDFVGQNFRNLQGTYIVPSGFKSSYLLMPKMKLFMNTTTSIITERLENNNFKQIEIPKTTTIETFKKSNHIRKPNQTYLLCKFDSEYYQELIFS